MTSSAKRENPAAAQQEDQQQQPEPKKSKNPSDDDNFAVVLNPADCDLDFDIKCDGRIGHALYEQGFAYCWSGARGSVGITGGKYCFGCRVIAAQPVEMEDTPLDQQNVCRIGISRGDDPVGNLGETERSYGFGGTGKFSTAGRFLDYGETFGVGDTILCLVDLETQPYGSIEFCKNGKSLGIARYIDAGPKGLGVIDPPAQKLPWESALFPHILLKNTVVQMQFSLEDGLIPERGFKPWALAVKEEKAVMGPSLANPADCEVMMMVGLPASGKTTWAEKWVKEHPEKRYVLLGTNLVLEQMKVPGLLRKHNYNERFERLMARATDIFNTLLSRAAEVPRNYIIDQTNVYKSARKRKLRPFASFHKIAVVVLPKAEEIELRAKKRFQEMGKEVPLEAVNEMLVNFVLPTSKEMRGADESFDQIIFTELNRFEAQQHLNEIKRALALSATQQPKTSPLLYSRESSVYSDSALSAYSFSGPGSAYSEYIVPSVAVAPGAWTGHPGAGQPFAANVNTGYTGYMQSDIGAQAQPYQANVNTGHSNYFPSADPTSYGGYTRDPYGPQPYGPPAGYMNNPEVAGPAYQSSYGPPLGTQTSRPYGHPNPSSYGHQNVTAYGHQNATAYGYGQPNVSAYGQPSPNSYGQPNPSPYGSYPAHVPPPPPPPGASVYAPPRYY